MEKSKPTNEQWAALYDAAAAFKQLAPWQWLYDRDLFGVQDPETGEVGYCCVLGALGEVLGLNVYLGPRGLRGYLGMQKGEYPEGDPDFVYNLDALVVHFDDRSLMEPEDVKRVKALGLSFKGKKSWPWFRRFEPGFHLRQITAAEAVFLTRALQQTVDMARRIKEDAGMLNKSGSRVCLVRVPSMQEERTVWEDAWQDIPVWKPPVVQVPPVDALRLQRLKQEAQNRVGIWEGDYFFSPAVIQEGGRPYYPQTVLWVETDAGRILAGELFSHEGFEKALQDHFLAMLEKETAFPREIHVKRIEVLQLLQPITEALQIAVSLQQELPDLEEARQAMEAFLRKK